MKKIFLTLILISFFNSCSVLKQTSDNTEYFEHKNLDQQKIYRDLRDILNEGLLMEKNGLRNNQDFCLGRAVTLQEQAASLKKISDEYSFVNLAMSANHLELCTSCNAPTAKDHCDWASDTLNEMRIMYGWN